MAERPLILFPAPENAERVKRSLPPPKTVYPTIDKQFNRLMPYYRALRNAFQQKSVIIQNSPIGINPEMALVFEVVGSVENFYTAVKNVEGMEWLFELSIDEIEPDDDFYYVDDSGQRKDSNLSGRVYCVMSNQEAIDQLISLWNRYVRGETEVFKQRGFAGFRNVFKHIKAIRRWGPQDKIYETNVMEYWKESLEFIGNQEVPFEIELFYRNDSNKRKIAFETVKRSVVELGGEVRSECVIDSINYHSMLVVLPREQIQLLVESYEQISIVSIDDIMFFRPVSQAAIKVHEDCTVLYTDSVATDFQPDAEPIIGIFDGMPIQNHKLLTGRLIVDDPDNYENDYLEKYRFHGTAMASLIIYGDLNRNDQVHNRKVYFHPVLKPELNSISGKVYELVPKDVIFVDVIHRAVKRMFEGEESTPAVAPTVKVINISIGDPARQFANIMSPLARLLDWLSFKYKVLFIVSAGNHNNGELNLGISFDEFKRLTQEQRSERVFTYLKNEMRNYSVLSPAESINSLTIGALYDDACCVTENDRQAAAVGNGLPSPISSFGLGYNRVITPDLYYFGGRKFLVRSIDGGLRWANGPSEPGCKVAAPYGDGTESGVAFSFGTSDAAAQITHEAGKCFDVLNEIFLNETGQSVPSDFAAVLIKGMLTHGASWDFCSDELSKVTSLSPNRLHRWLGNGAPDISRVIECTDRRITLVGLGKLKPNAAHVYSLPLPFDFSKQLVKRKLIVTLAYFTPISPTKQRYRTTKIWFEVYPSKLFPCRQNTDWQSVQKGTLQHEIFSGDKTVVWDADDSIEIKVNCKNDAGNYKDAVEYSLFVTFEVVEGLDVDVYTSVVNKIRQVVPITALKY